MTEAYQVDGVAVVKYLVNNSQKSPIIMVHGGNHAGWCWQKWAPFFNEAGYEVHVLDWYNHGASQALPPQTFLTRSLVDIADKEIQSVAKQFTQPPIIIGHSMGGLAAAAYATKKPVAKLVLAAPVMTAAAAAPPIPIPVDMNSPVPVFPYPQAKQMFFTKSSDAEAQAFYAQLEPESPQAVSEATQSNVTLNIAAITAPVLVVGAEFDQIIAAEPLKHYAKLLHATFVQADGVGHSDMLLKQPEWQAAATKVQAWLDAQ